MIIRYAGQHTMLILLNLVLGYQLENAESDTQAMDCHLLEFSIILKFLDLEVVREKKLFRVKELNFHVRLFSKKFVAYLISLKLSEKFICLLTKYFGDFFL
jgi:hypothetical protein